MAGSSEDCASVLEQFIHESANLPAEINYMMEEIQAKDRDMQKFLTAIATKDSNLQKHVKANGGMQPHPKESEYAEKVKKEYDLCSQLQDQKMQLSEKACALLERQVKKLDVKIRELQNDGQLTDGPPLPSIFNRKPDVQKSFIDAPQGNLPLQTSSPNVLNANAQRVTAQIATATRQPQSRQLAQIITALPTQRASAPATPASALHQQRQQEREHSAGADPKRRKIPLPASGLSIPAQPSSLRQSSIGPGTPKAGTPTGGSRAGSVPRSLTGQQAGTTKKSGVSKKGPTHQQVNKLKNKHTKHARLSQGAGRKKGQSPSIRGGRGGTVASEEDSVLSSGDASETDASQGRARRGNKKARTEDVEMGEDEEVDEEDGEDDRRYCTCNQRSYGEMVACENDDCPYQWFHTGCLNMKRVPDEDEDWYCPTCRVKPEIIEKMRQKQKKLQKK